MSEIVIYHPPDNQTQVEVRIEQETVWLLQQQIKVVFGTQRPAVTKHIKNIFSFGELNENVVSSILEHTAPHAALKDKTQTKNVKYYNLDAVISVSYRVNSKCGTLLYQWAHSRFCNNSQTFTTAA